MVPEYDPPKKKRKNRRVSEADLGIFLRQYGRKAPSSGEPNDRHYSRRIESKVKGMSPEDLDRLLRSDED